jgi:hypothetical protein
MVGGNPNVGRMDFSANTYCFDPAIDINSMGQIGLGFMESDTVGGAINAATGGFTSTFVTARQPTDAAGTMQPVVLVPAGTGSGNIHIRTGDFSGMNVDPVNGTFWHANEFGGGGPTDIANFTPNAPPVITPPGPQSAVEGASQSFSLGSFADPDGGPWSVDVSWGDGTPDTVFAATAPGTISSQTHTYGEEGGFTGTITVTDTLEGQFDSKPFSVTVSDPSGLATGVPVFATACRPLTGVPIATFTDPGGAEPNPSDPSGGIANHYKVDSIDWGDSTPLDTTTGTISYNGSPGSTTDPFTVNGSHTYQTEGTFTITVMLDHEGVLTTVTTTAIVKDKLGLLLLDPTGSKSLMVTGNGNVDVTGDCGAVVVNSSDARAAFVTGNGVVAAGDFDVTGGVFTAGHGVVPSPVDHEAPTPDPLGLALPSPLPPPPVGNTPTVLNPGTYVVGLQISGKAVVTLLPGVYVMEGGGFSVSDQASVSGTGVVIINAPGGPGDDISVSGHAVVTISAPSSGTFQGVAMFQDPASSNTVSFSSQANVAIAGVFDAPAAPVSITGNAVVTINPGAGTATLPPINAGMIAYDAKVTGNGVLTINADDPPLIGASHGATAGGTAASAADVHAAALDAFVSSGGLNGQVTLDNSVSIDQLAVSLANATDLANGFFTHSKKKG